MTRPGYELPEKVQPRDLLDAIESFSFTERNKQVQIGVSEVGMACIRCVVRKLAELEKSELVSSWRAQLGTYVHAGLADEFEKRWAKTGQVLVENSLFVHAYKNFVLRGSCDIFFPGAGLVADWKIVGDDTLAQVASGKIKEQYIIQGHLYGLGWALKGFDVQRVAIMFLPANKGNLQRDAVPVEFDWDASVAARALAKIEALIDLAEEIGWKDVLRQYPPLPGCLNCRQYKAVDDPVHDLLLR